MAQSEVKKIWRKMTGKVPGSAKAVPPPSPGRDKSSFDAFESDIVGDAFAEHDDSPGHSQPSSAFSLSSHSDSPTQLTKRGQLPSGDGTHGATTSRLSTTASSSSSSSAAGGGGAAAVVGTGSSRREMRHSRSASDITAEAAQAATGRGSTSGLGGGAAAAAAGSSGGAGRTTLGSVSPSPGGSPVKANPTREELRMERFRKLLHAPNLDMDALRKIGWSGVPGALRPLVWGLLSGYLPANVERRAATLARKREEYAALVAQYYGSRVDEGNQGTFHQIHIDVLRTNPSLSIFQQPAVQEMMERILYIWAIRHPGSGYVQGINDLTTPFLAVYLSANIEGALEDCSVASVAAEVRDVVEADCYWGLTKLLDGIQDNYTFASPGIQKNVRNLKELVSRLDKPLQQHLETHNIEYLQFSFRWMNCLLLRELPLHCVIRLWDTYFAEGDGFASFHLYTCAAFLITFSKELRACSDFQSMMILLQNLPTHAWTDKEMELVVSEAYRLKYTFHDALHHLNG